jgi:hypothetical protein
MPAIALIALAILIHGAGAAHADRAPEPLAASAPMRDSTVVTGYAPVDGGKLYYEVTGAGPVVVLIHGGQMDKSAGRWTLVAPEHGHGHGDGGRLSKRYHAC